VPKPPRRLWGLSEVEEAEVEFDDDDDDDAADDDDDDDAMADRSNRSKRLRAR